MFHINLRNRRMFCGLSQKQVADYLNITPQSVSKWEKGDALPSIEYLPKLAECLKCDINAFFKSITEKAVDNTLLLQILTLMNEAIYEETKTKDDVIDFEREHPSAINTLIAFCTDVKNHKTLSHKVIQGMLGCTESEAREIIGQMAKGELIEKLDIEDTYFVVIHVVDGLIILLKLYLTEYEQTCAGDDFDFKMALYDKF